MKRGRSTTTPTKEEAARFEAIREYGCLVCRAFFNMLAGAEIHHLTIGGRHGQKRRGHLFSIGLCPYHHRGHQQDREPLYLGPSYALQPKKFRERFGQDDELLEKQNRLLETGSIE